MSLVRAQQGEPKKTITKVIVFFYPIRKAWYIITDEVRCISSITAKPLLNLITFMCIALRLDDIQHFVLMICNSYGIDFIHACGVIFRRNIIANVPNTSFCSCGHKTRLCLRIIDVAICCKRCDALHQCHA